MEEWRYIPGYEGRYEVSSNGNVRSVPHVFIRKDGKQMTVQGLQLMQQTDKKGYRRIRLIDNSGKKRGVLVHRAVAEAFIDNPNNDEFVNHIDGNKGNNKSSNLEWCSPRDNVRHAWRNGLASNNINYAINALKKPVISDTGKIYESVKEASEDTGIDKTLIAKVCSGKYRQTHGRRFKYLEGE